MTDTFEGEAGEDKVICSWQNASEETKKLFPDAVAFHASHTDGHVADCDSWKCLNCGNTVDSDGFLPCDEDGREIEPTPELWTKPLYVCGGCGNVYSKNSGERYFTSEDVAAGYAEKEGEKTTGEKGAQS